MRRARVNGLADLRSVIPPGVTAPGGTSITFLSRRSRIDAN
jgi:hypothetical protein